MSTPTIKKITGQTPKGNGFTLTPYRLEWHAHGDVGGSIDVPLKADAPLHEIANEITRTGRVSDETRALWFNC